MAVGEGVVVVGKAAVVVGKVVVANGTDLDSRNAVVLAVQQGTLDNFARSE